MSNCCDEHDICYDTCNSDKELCDLDFKRCLYKVNIKFNLLIQYININSDVLLDQYCDTYEKSAVGGDMMVKGCKGAAKMLFTGTLTLGCRSYLDAQAKSCYCPGTTTGKNSGPDSKPNNYNANKNNKHNYDSTPSSTSRPDQKGKSQQTPPSYGWKDKKDL